MSWRAELQGEALRQMYGLPAPVFELLARTLARIGHDPRDPCSAPGAVFTGQARADLADFGFIEFIVDDEAGLVSVYNQVDRLKLPEGAIMHITSIELRRGRRGRWRRCGAGRLTFMNPE